MSVISHVNYGCLPAYITNGAMIRNFLSDLATFFMLYKKKKN